MCRDYENGNSKETEIYESENLENQPILVTDETDIKTQTSRLGVRWFRSAIVIIGSIALLLITAGIYVGTESFHSDGAIDDVSISVIFHGRRILFDKLLRGFQAGLKRMGMLDGNARRIYSIFQAGSCGGQAPMTANFSSLQRKAKQPADMPWVFRYVPFANLYDLSLAFAFGAGVTTLLVIRGEKPIPAGSRRSRSRSPPYFGTRPIYWQRVY